MIFCFGRIANFGCLFFSGPKAVAVDYGGGLRVFYVGRRWVGLM